MKNLPKKIYLNLGDLTKEEYNELDFHDLSEVTWSKEDVQGRNVEYVLKDVLIKKACEWMKEQKEMIGISFQEDFIERFKKYMKGK